MIVIGYTWSGRVNFTFNPTIENDYIQGELEMPTGTPIKRTREVIFIIEEAAKRAIAKLEDENPDLVSNIRV